MAQKLKQDIHFGNNILRLHKQAHLTQEQVTTHLQLQGIEISRSSYNAFFKNLTLSVSFLPQTKKCKALNHSSGFTLLYDSTVAVLF